MGQKVHPTGVRVGIIKDWNAKWYADSKNFADYLVEDHKIREYVKKKLFISGISKIEIERTAKFVKVNVFTAKPGLVIGKGGNLSEALKAELEKMINKEVNLNIVEVKNIDIDAFGSALGLCKLSKTLGKDCYIVSEPEGKSLDKFLESFNTYNEYNTNRSSDSSSLHSTLKFSDYETVSIYKT